MPAQYFSSGYSLPIPAPSKESQRSPYSAQTYYLAPQAAEENMYSAASASTSYTNTSFGRASSPYSPDVFTSRQYIPDLYDAGAYTPKYCDSRNYVSSNHTYSNRSASNSTNAGRSVQNMDFSEYMNKRAASIMDPVPLDRSMVTQAQTSGKLNDKHRQLVDKQREAAGRLAHFRERYHEGLRDAREVQQELEWTQQKVQSLKSKAQRKYGKEYARAQSRYIFVEAD
ncbi:hypothetical protein BROUX41_005307 [Berkeleyomyces rouxiae]|uniref:uncharacterized protein n=1 Tax=Berkeleyomyces rouxiae TaxID=2035830 RepID=UPI003B812BEB